MRASAAKKLIATENEATASGVITYWSLSGTISFEKLKTAWIAGGLAEDQLPQPPSAMVALKRAIDHVTPDACIIKPLKDEDGYTVIRKVTEEGAKQKWETLFSAFVSESGRLTVWVADGDSASSDVTTSDKSKKLAGDIEDYVEIELGTLHSIDISTWLVRMVDHRFSAVSLRDTGGFYFIPRGINQEVWERVAGVLDSVSAVRIMTIPAMHSEQASLAVLQALTDEISSNTKNLQEALDEARMGKRALDTKIGACVNMLDKIETYEGLLGERLTDLRGAVDGLRAKYVEAWVVADAKAE